MSKNRHRFNRLKKEKSPYLLLHAKNPVNWYPWGPEAFAEAREKNLPIFLSVGYATCHWCHVMEKESFENREVARYLNEHFVSIKVDREERPDVDQIYMKALQSLGQGGGWPMSMFLTPELLPFTGGTYFPPSRRGQTPGFLEVLRTVQHFWNERTEQVLDSARSITEFLQNTARENSGQDSWDFDESLFETADRTLLEAFDEKRGGFLFNGPNKFPPSLILLYLSRRFEMTKNPHLLEAINGTLHGMLNGGIYDQVGGGLARYSTDHEWLIPHFEKMLYDNALFAMSLLEGFRISGDHRFREGLESLFSWVEETMTSPEGVFYSAVDADSPDGEGSYYLWSEQEFQETLGREFSPEEIKKLKFHLGISEEGNFEGKNILHRVFLDSPFDDTSQETLDHLIQKALPLLKKKRSRRPHPAIDDKVLTSWNSYMIQALTRASRFLNRPDYHRIAVRAMDFFLERMTGPDGRLFRRFRDGEASLPAGLLDYASLGNALLDLFRTDFQPRWLEEARNLLDPVQRLFSGDDGGLFFDTPEDSSDLIVRNADTYDGVEPSGNGALLQFLVDLSGYGFEMDACLKKAHGIVASLKPSLERGRSYAHPNFLESMTFLFSPPPEVVALYGGNLPEEDLELLRKSLPTRTSITFASEQDPRISKLPLLEGRELPENKDIIYFVCRKGVCFLPVHTVKEALNEIQKTEDL